MAAEREPSPDARIAALDGFRATRAAMRAQRAAAAQGPCGRELRLEALGFHEVATDDAGVFAGRVQYAHPLDALAEMIDPETGKPFLTPDEYDAGAMFAVAYHRAGITRSRGCISDQAQCGGGGEMTDATAEYAARWRAMAKRLGDSVDLVIDVCCFAKMPASVGSRSLARALGRLI